jgi:hypothetical protein
MSAPTVYTYYDLIESLKDFAAGHGFSATQTVMRRAVQTAHRELVAVRDWQWLYKLGRIQLVAAVNDGTVTYDHSGGVYERMLTLSGGTWPSWIEDGVVRIDGETISEVESKKSSSIVTLDVQQNPGQDVAAGTSYVAYRRWYPLPNDFVALWSPLEDESWLRSQYRPIQDLAALERYQDTTGDVHYFAVGSAPGLYGTHALYVSWPSDATETLDIPYKRRPRTLRYSGHDANDMAGTISVTAGSTAVTCSGTSLSDGMVGSILRIGTGATAPTGLEGLTPYAEQRTIVAVSIGSTETMTLDAAVETTRSGVAYRISDPIDLPEDAYEALRMGAEKHVANANRKSVSREMMGMIVAAYQEALHNAKCADHTVLQRRVAGSYLAYVSRVADGTLGETVE